MASLGKGSKPNTIDLEKTILLSGDRDFFLQITVLHLGPFSSDAINCSTSHTASTLHHSIFTGRMNNRYVYVPKFPVLSFNFERDSHRIMFLTKAIFLPDPSINTTRSS
jgi:hypothetical protein